MARKCWFLIGVLFLAIAYPTGVAYGQAVYGSIVGSVTDASGAVVPSAKVTITDVNKNVSFTTTTNTAGDYEQTHLIAGTYEVKIEAQGFQTFVQSAVQVIVDAVARVNAVMQVGAVTQRIEVTGVVPLLQTERTDVATNFSERQVEDLPIYNRNFTTFQLLSPGSARLNGWNHAASENPQGSGQIMTQGQHFSGTAFELDGTDNQDPILGIIIINPNLEAVTETKITAQDYDAQFGKAMGDVVTTQTKSGSNVLHGSAFDFERANADFARNPFTQATINVPSGNWQQFGGALGGPIRKNKVFIFGDYQGTRSDVGGSVGDRIPTAAERGGDLSDLGIAIYDPYETTDATHQTLVLNAQGQPIPLAFANRTQFPGNVIPTSRLSPQTQSLLALLPVGASGTGLSPNYFGSGVNLLNSNGFDVRSDAYATEKLHIFGRYSFQQFARSGPGLFGVAVGGPAIPSDPSVGTFSGISGVRNQSLASGADYTLSPTWLTDFRFGYHRYRVNVLPGGYGTQPATAAGIPGLNLDKTYTSGMPYFAISTPGAQLFSFGYALGNSSEIQCNCPLTEREYQYQFVDNWTNIRGSHTIKFGADIRYNHNLRVPSDTHRAGQLAFNNDITEGPGGVGGAGLAGFLLGDVSTFGRYISTSTNAFETQPRLFFYGEDSWRVTHKLTFNFGLRWEIYEPESVAGTGEGGWVDLATGEMRVAGQQGVDMRGNTTTSFTHLAPRLGLAYQASPKTVIRVGYGRSYDMGIFGTIFGHTVTQNLPVLAAQNISPGPGNTAFALAQGPPAAAAVSTILTQNNCNAITDPTGATVINATTNTFTPDKTECVGPNGRALIPDGWNSRARPFNNRLPTVDAYNATLQRQVTSTIAATVAYVGNKGTHNMYGDDDNYELNQSGTVVGYNPNTPGITGPVLPSNCTNPSMLPHLCREPYYLKYGWTQSISYFGNDANSLYSALVATVEKRFAGGLSFQSSYTYQRSSDNETAYFNINHNVYHGPSNDYRDQVWILTEVYELPFGKGKKFLGSPSRVLDAAIGGWKLNSATNFSGGLPFTPGLSTCGPTIDFGPCMPDKVGTVANGPRSGPPGAAGYWFQLSPVPLTTAGETGGPWGQPALDTFGNVGRNSFRGPKWFDTDLAMFKDFTVTEKVKAQMQFQFYNIFNHVNLGLPNGCVDCSNGGSITNINWGAQMRAITFGLKFAF
jgi:hypothetical protein